MGRACDNYATPRTTYPRQQRTPEGQTESARATRAGDGAGETRARATGGSEPEMTMRGGRRPRRATGSLGGVEPGPDPADQLLARANEESYAAAERERREMHVDLFRTFRQHPLTEDQMRTVQTCANVALDTVLRARGGAGDERAAREGSDFAECGALYGFVLGLRLAGQLGQGA